MYVSGADNSELRRLTVENTGGFAYATGVWNSGASPKLSHVSATAFGGTFGYGVYNFSSSSPTMTNVTDIGSSGTDSGSGATTSYGVINNFSSSPIMTNVTATGSGGTDTSYGTHNSSSNGRNGILLGNLLAQCTAMKSR